MLVFPNCKINLGLHIASRREDSYHNIETVFYPLEWKDLLESIVQHPDNNASIRFTSSGLKIDTNPEQNLCVKAYRLLHKDFPALSAVHLHLHKMIPMGAGLGGGSADAAFTLRLLNEQFRLQLSTEQLIHYAAKLGSDCPFFILNTPCFAKGRGEMLEPITLNLDQYQWVLINPGIHISTAQAFSNIQPHLSEKGIRDIIQQPIHSWAADLKNDFEVPLFNQYPILQSLKQQLYLAGAIYASMSGSGSSVYGIFESSKKIVLEYPETYIVHLIPAKEINNTKMGMS